MARGGTRLALVSAPGALAGLERGLARSQVRVDRVVVLSIEPRPQARIERALREFGGFDTLLVTSTEAVEAFVAPHSPALHRTRPPIDVWAVGPATASRLRALGFPRVRRAEHEGVDAAVRALRRRRPRSVLYVRSDRAGPRAARALRARGDRVLDLVVYSVRPVPRLSPVDHRVLSRASALLVSSPSALSALRLRLAAREFSRLRARVPLVVLGERTLRAARGHGFRGVRRAPSASVHVLTYYVRREFRNGVQ